MRTYRENGLLNGTSLLRVRQQALLSLELDIMQDDDVADVNVVQSRLNSVPLLFPDHCAQIGIRIKTSIGHRGPDQRSRSSVLRYAISERAIDTCIRLTLMTCFLLESISLPAALATLTPCTLAASRRSLYPGRALDVEGLELGMGEAGGIPRSEDIDMREARDSERSIDTRDARDSERSKLFRDV